MSPEARGCRRPDRVDRMTTVNRRCIQDQHHSVAGRRFDVTSSRVSEAASP